MTKQVKLIGVNIDKCNANAILFHPDRGGGGGYIGLKIELWPLYFPWMYSFDPYIFTECRVLAPIFQHLFNFVVEVWSWIWTWQGTTVPVLESSTPPPPLPPGGHPGILTNCRIALCGPCIVRPLYDICCESQYRRDACSPMCHVWCTIDTLQAWINKCHLML